MARDLTSDDLKARQKARAQRIDHDYHAKKHPWRSRYRLFNWSLGIFSAVILAAAIFVPGGDNLYLPGPVSTKHAIFATRCNECHESGPIEGQWGAVSDAKCLNCHDGPVHHVNMVHHGSNTQTAVVDGHVLDVPSPTCASCHSEHRGNQELARIASRHCTQCHEDLKVSEGAPKWATRITDFATDHPDWGMFIRKDQDLTPIKLNHKTHMGMKWSEAQIADRQKYDPDFIKAPGTPMGCVDCHGPNPQRDYMKPINYEMHCSSCHPLALPPIDDIGAVMLPHDKPAIVASMVETAFKNYLIKNGGKTPAAKVLNPDWKKAPRSQKKKYPKYIDKPDPRTPEQWLKDNVTETLDPMFFPPEGKYSGTCMECHSSEGKDETAGLPKIIDPQIPVSWFPKNPSHGKHVSSVLFNHETHRVINCNECHGQANESELTTDILLPNIQNCRTCHSPSGGAQSGCMECHLYHNKNDSNFLGMRTLKELQTGVGMGDAMAGVISRHDRKDEEAVEPEAPAPDPKPEPEAKTPDATPETKPESKTPDTTAETKPEPKAEPKTEAKPAPAKQAIYEGKTVVCPTCGMRWPGRAKFCARCGTHFGKSDLKRAFE